MIRSLFAVVAALVGLAVLAGPVGADHHRDPAPVPTLTDVSATTRPPALFTVTGTDFTAGGRVYLAVYDRMGATLYETRWVTASRATVTEPYWGEGQYGGAVTTAGGTLHEAFDHLCGAAAMMRALDEQTATWSNWLEVAPACAGPAGVVPESTTP